MKYIHRLPLLLIAFFPTQVGIHFWFNASLVLGRRVDYLAPTLYLVDILLITSVLVGISTLGLGKGRFRILFFLALGIGALSLISGTLTHDLTVWYAGIRMAEWLLLVWIVFRFQLSIREIMV